MAIGKMAFKRAIPSAGWETAVSYTFSGFAFLLFFIAPFFQYQLPRQLFFKLFTRWTKIEIGGAQGQKGRMDVPVNRKLLYKANQAAAPGKEAPEAKEK